MDTINETSCFADLHRLAKHEKSFALLPIGWGNKQKGPMLEGWQHHGGFSVAELQQQRRMRSVGVRTGFKGPLLCFDFDGESALELACSLDMEPWAVSTWQVHRDTDPFASKFYLSQHQIKLRSSLMALNFKAKPLLNKRFWMPMARQSKWVKPWKFFFMVDAKSLSWVNTQAVVAFTFGPQNQAWDLKHFHLRQMPGWITQSKLQSSATIDPNQAANPAQLALASAG